MARGMRRGDGGIRISSRYLSNELHEELGTDDEDLIISIDDLAPGRRTWTTHPHLWAKPLTGDDKDNA